MRTALQTLGQLSHRGEVPPGKAADVQQQEILSRPDARGTRSPFAEAQESRQLKAKLGQSDELWLGDQGGGFAAANLYHSMTYLPPGCPRSGSGSMLHARLGRDI